MDYDTIEGQMFLSAALDELNVEITCTREGLEWFWQNTVTGEEGLQAYSNSRDALMDAAEEFGLIEPNYDEPDYDDSCGMTDMEADADVLKSAGMGTDEDYGLFHDSDMDSHMAYDHLERDHDEPYEGA